METLTNIEVISSKRRVSFKNIFDEYDWGSIQKQIYSKERSDVEKSLNKHRKRTLDDFMALISPAAESYLEDMAKLSQQLTQKRFGKTIQLFAPLYLSNECSNICTYCGFSLSNQIKRTTLSLKEIEAEAKVVKSHGFDHVLIVTGESNKNVGITYFEEALKIIKPYFAHVSMEVQPLLQEEYERLISMELNTVMVYQETYHKESYKQYHPKGKKSNFYNRLMTPDNLGKSRIHKIGLGSLIGLTDWRTDSWFTALHLDYLEKKYWETRYSISFPRLRPAIGYSSPKVVMTDKQLVQLICAYRIFNEDVELSISTRETENLRNNFIKLGITSMSAGSKTNPGGYSIYPETLEQFSISDERTPLQVSTMIKRSGYEVIWKDWYENLPVNNLR